MQKIITILLTIFTLYAGAQTPATMHFDYDDIGEQRTRSFVPFFIYLHPKDQQVCPGTSVNFEVGATNALAPLTYQWRKNGANISSTSNPSAITKILSLTANENANYSCLVNGTESNQAKLVLLQTPTIISSPGSERVCLGNSATFSTQAASLKQPIVYQWFRNGVQIAGANGSSYTTPGTGSIDASSSYYCQVGGCGTTNTGTAILNVDNPTVAGWISGRTQAQVYSSIQLTVSGNTGTLTQVESSYPNSMTWNVLSTYPTNPMSVFTSAGTTGNFQYRILVKNGVCPSVYTPNFTVAVVPLGYVGYAATGASLKRISIGELSSNENKENNNLKSSVITDDLLLFPNPSSGTFSLSLGCDAEGEGSIEIKDAMAHTLKTEPIHKVGFGFYETYHFSDLTSGLYFIEVNLPMYRKTGKLIIQ